MIIIELQVKEQEKSKAKVLDELYKDSINEDDEKIIENNTKETLRDKI